MVDDVGEAAMSRQSAQAQRDAVRQAAVHAPHLPTVGERAVNRHLAVQGIMSEAPRTRLSTAAVHLHATERALAGYGHPAHHEHAELVGKDCDVVVDDVGIVSVRFE